MSQRFVAINDPPNCRSFLMKYLIALVLALIGGAASSSPTYSVRLLTSPGSPTSLAYGINAAGNSVGFVLSGDSQRLVATQFGTTPSENITLADLGQQFGVAYAINASGDIAGYSRGANGENRAVIFNGNTGAIIDLGIGTANGLNDTGQVVGTSTSGAALFHTDGSPVTNLASFQGGFAPSVGYSYAAAINNNQVAIGVWGDGSGASRAVRFDITSARKSVFGTLGGSTSVAQDINDAGQGVGYSTLLGDGVGRAALFSNDGATVTDLGDFGGAYGFANAINNSGRIVGSATTVNEEYRAFIWVDGAIQDLNDLVGDDFDSVIVAATDINDFGAITAVAVDLEGRQFAIVLDPTRAHDVSEPPVSLLIALGVACLGLTRRSSSRGFAPAPGNAVRVKR